MPSIKRGLRGVCLSFLQNKKLSMTNHWNRVRYVQNAIDTTKIDIIRTRIYFVESELCKGYLKIVTMPVIASRRRSNL